MSILIDESTKVIVQGITGRDGSFHAKKMLEYGTKVVAGVTPGKGGHKEHDIPVYDGMAEAVKATGANTSIIFVPPVFAADAVYEAADSGVALIIIVTEGLPVHDMLKIDRYLRSKNIRYIGPNCPGLISPGKSKVGIMSADIHLKGGVGVVSRSGTLTYEVVYNMTKAGIGQSTCIGIGGDPIVGTSFIDALTLFEKDPETTAVAMIGEIGGSDEEEAAKFIATMKKPVVSFIAGRTAPPGKRMGHAGAIISGTSGTAEAKIRALNDAGVEVANTPQGIAELLAHKLTVGAAG
jgi:succinyl-CoA synthetase alpha subunit